MENKEPCWSNCIHCINGDEGNCFYLNNSSIDERMYCIKKIKDSNIDNFKNTYIYLILEQRKKCANILYKSWELTDKTYEYQVMFNDFNNKIKDYFLIYNI
jgi:hypothetical protein